MFFAKLKILFRRKPASDRSARQPQQTLEIQTTNSNTSVVKLPTRCVSARPSSLLVLAKTAQGQEAEKLFPQQFIQEVSFYCTLQIDRPISVGALANWIQTLITDGVHVSELNYILGIDCQDLTLTQSVDAVVPLDIVIAETSPILDIPTAADACISVALCNDIYTTPTTPKQSPLAFIVDEPTPTTPCPKSSLPESTPILCRLTALQSVNDLSVLDIKQPQFTSTQSTPFTERLSTQDFDIIGVLGKGGFGTAYAARFNWNGGCVALKAIRKRVREVKRKRAPRADTFGEDVFAPAVKGAANKIGSVSAKNCQSVIDEWLAMQRLGGLGGVAEVLASWHDSNNFYIAMPLYNGGDLQTRLMREGGRFSLDVARFYMAELLNGLENIHSRGVVHRDLKLANVLIGPDGRLKIADFGLARCFEQYASEFERTINPELATMGKAGADRFPEVTNTGCGTPEYAAPEVFREDLYSYNVDVWSAGVMAFKMIVGRSPWTGADNDVALALHVTEGKYEIENREQEEYGINEDAVFFIQRALDKDASTRPSAARMKGHLFFKSFDWSGLENNTLEAPWVPNASEAFTSRSCQQGTDIDAGSPLSSSEDHIPYFNYLSPRMADAPTTLLTMVSSPSFPPAPQLVGYPIDSIPSSASGIQLANREIECDNSSTAPFSQFWADRHSVNFEASPMAQRESLGLRASLGRGKSESSPVFELRRPGTLNLASNPIDSSPTNPSPSSFSNFWDTRREHTNVPTSASRMSLNPIDYVLREESDSLPFVSFRPHNPQILESPLDAASPSNACERKSANLVEFPRSTSRMSLDFARIALREESCSLPFFLYRSPISSRSESPLSQSQLHYSSCRQLTPPISLPSFDIATFVRREESASLPFLPSKVSPRSHASTSVTLYDMDQLSRSQLSNRAPIRISKFTPSAALPTTPHHIPSSRMHLIYSTDMVTGATSSPHSPNITLCTTDNDGLILTPQLLKASSGQMSHSAAPVVSLPSVPTSPTPESTFENLSSPKDSLPISTHSLIPSIPLSVVHIREDVTTPLALASAPIPLFYKEPRHPSPSTSLNPLQRFQNRVRFLYSLFLSVIRFSH